MSTGAFSRVVSQEIRRLWPSATKSVPFFFTHSSFTLTRPPQTLLAGQLLWVTAVTFIRASVIFLYIHIFVKRPFRIACYVVLTVNMAYFTATMLACCLICRPFAYNWDQSIRGTCGDQKSLDLFIGVFNLLMDITTVALPLPVLWGLQMPTGRKIAISALMSMGTTYEQPPNPSSSFLAQR